MEQKKKPTNAQLQKRISKAVVFVDRTADTKEVFFSDNGLRIIVTDNEAVVSQNSNQTHIYPKVLSYGYSRPYLYLGAFVDIALRERANLETKDGYSFHALMDSLKAKEDNKEFSVCRLVEMWLFNITTPTYSIGEADANVFLVFQDYCYNLARTTVFLEEKTDGLTTHQFADAVIDKFVETVRSTPDSVLFEKKSDEQLIQEEMDAMTEHENEELLTPQDDK
jgi:hypothetical protein